MNVYGFTVYGLSKKTICRSNKKTKNDKRKTILNNGK
jgi:hypothetical protein